MSTTTPTTPAIATTTTTAITALHWFEIPVHDLDRAQRAYEAVLGRPLRREAMGPQVTLAVFEYAPERGCGGCLIAGSAGLQPGGSGVRIYLNAEPSLDAAVGRAEAAGLRIEVPRVDLPGAMGAYAVIIDTEGNRVGLHAQQ